MAADDSETHDRVTYRGTQNKLALGFGLELIGILKFNVN